MNRKNFALKRCGMAVLSVNMTYWTYHTEKALTDEGNIGARKYAKICENLVKNLN
jgi:hypothetical protein